MLCFQTRTNCKSFTNLSYISNLFTEKATLLLGRDFLYPNLNLTKASLHTPDHSLSTQISPFHPRLQSRISRLPPRLMVSWTDLRLCILVFSTPKAQRLPPLAPLKAICPALLTLILSLSMTLPSIPVHLPKVTARRKSMDETHLTPPMESKIRKR